MFRVFANGLIFFSVLFCAEALAAKAPVLNPAKEKLRTYIQAQDITTLTMALRDSVGYTITIEEVKKLAEEEKYESLKKALKAACAIKNLELTLDMSMAELVQITYFIETRLKAFIQAKKYYLTTRDSGLSRALEYDPITNSTFIHLDMKNSACLGIGAKKRVTKSILYNPDTPEVLARLDQYAKCRRELEISKKLKGVNGVLQVKAYTERQENGMTYHTMFCKLYRQGTIFQVLKNSDYQFTVPEKMHMALSIVKGLEGMQKRNIVHKDLHHHNYLVNISKSKKSAKRTIEVVIADLGLANYIWKKGLHKRPQGDTHYTPPEAFLKKLSGKDLYATDLFAVGCLLYQIYYEKVPRWQMDEFMKKTGSAKQRAERLYQLIEKSTVVRRSFLDAKSRKGVKLTSKQEFERLILQMVHPNPRKRLKTKQARKKLEEVMKRQSGRISRFNMQFLDFSYQTSQIISV